MSIFKKQKKEYFGDLEKTSLLADLFEVEIKKRDELWKDSLFKNIGSASFRCGNPQVILGPDGFPYFQLLMPTSNLSFECFVIDHMMEDFILEKGYGIVINSHKENPDWVFSYGDILNYFLIKEFYSKKNPDKLINKEIIEKDTKVLIGQPSESIFPVFTRELIKNTLKNIGIKNVKLFLMHRSDKNIQEIVFNLTPNTLKDEEQFNNAMNIISWYLTRHYAFCGMDEGSYRSDFCKL